MGQSRIDQTVVVQHYLLQGFVTFLNVVNVEGRFLSSDTNLRSNVGLRYQAIILFIIWRQIIVKES